MDDNEFNERTVRAWRLTPIFDPKPGSISNAGTTFCIATGEYLLGTSIGDALSPAIVRQLRKTDKARIVCDAELVEAAAEFLRTGGLHKRRVAGRMLTREQVADQLAPPVPAPERQGN